MFEGSCGHSFFFFQAEDGIRDLTVTGVQTCALPIYDGFQGACQGSTVFSRGRHREFLHDIFVGNARDYNAPVRARVAIPLETEMLRSEERRVGKECRSRWSPYH